MYLLVNTMNFEKKLFKQLLVPLICNSSVAYSNQNDLMNLSVEDLLNVEVISVSKKSKSLNDSPAAVFVISQDDIKRIGATSIPDALRLAPGLDVSRIDANKWAITARGFNGRFANKLLVLIDGRNTYTRTFAGVYWENQDVMLEDVERIEVIRGPGATLWGANAVNGVINIITKHSADTQGGILVAGGGTQEQGFGALRYGGKLNTDTTARAYIKGFKKNENTFESGDKAGDDWDKVQGGFRVDSQLSTQDNLTIHGDAYRSKINQNVTFPLLSAPYITNFNETVDSFGGNLLALHQHTFSSSSDYSLQFYYDFYHRDDSFATESRHTLDINFQHSFTLLSWNDLVWGAEYRYSHDDTSINFIKNINSISPKSRNDQLFSVFLQNEITLIDNALWLTLGSKFEHNDYSGFETQPTARIMWIPHDQNRIWISVSKALKTPSRIDHDAKFLGLVTPPSVASNNLPSAIIFKGNNQFNSEQVISYELGYRTTLIDNVSIDFAAFYNSYSHLRSIHTRPPTFNPITGNIEISSIFRNDSKAQTYGLEIAAVWQMLDWWRWDTNYNLLKTNFSNKSDDISPQQRVSLRSAISPWHNFDIDILFRYVDRNKTTSILGTSDIDAYASMDISTTWRPISDIEISLVGQNLLANHHLEYRQESFVQKTEIDRGVYGKLMWHF